MIDKYFYQKGMILKCTKPRVCMSMGETFVVYISEEDGGTPYILCTVGNHFMREVVFDPNNGFEIIGTGFTGTIGRLNQWEE